MSSTLLLTALLLASEGFITGKCEGDIEQFCASVTEGEGQVMSCLRANQSKLTSSCRAELEQQREDLGAEVKRANRKIAASEDRLKKSCGPEVKKFCPGNLEGLKLTACLNEHRDSASGKCASFLEDLRRSIGGP